MTKLKEASEICQGLIVIIALLIGLGMVLYYAFYHLFLGL